jgi:hypothetical protein
MRIYCPLCTWEPHPDDRWVCAPGCFTVWNTFDTRARCPGCAKQWRFTACHACHVMSPHDEWYHDDALDEADADEVEETVEVGAGGTAGWAAAVHSTAEDAEDAEEINTNELVLVSSACSASSAVQKKSKRSAPSAVDHWRSYRTVPITSVPAVGSRAPNVSGVAAPTRTNSESPRTV